MSITNYPNGLSSFGQNLYGNGTQPDTSGNTFFMDLNVANSGDGKSWDEAVSTVAAALALADTDIGNSAIRAWARRNTVYACGDGIAEALVLASEKTDLIGVGTDVGSFPKITGNFTIGTAVNGFRIFNMGFVPTTTAPCITFPAGMHGWELHGVTIYKVEGLVNTSGIQAITSRDWVMNGVRICPDAGGAYNTIAFTLTTNTAGIGRSIIDNCLFVGTEAFDVADGGYFEGSICKNSTFIATALCIDDNSDSIAFVDNNLITAATITTKAGAGVVDWNAVLAAGNYATGADTNGPLPDLAAHTS